MRSFICLVLGFIVSVSSVGCNCVQRSHYDPQTGMIYPTQFQRPKLFAKKKKHDAATCPLCNPHGVAGNQGHSHDGHTHHSDGHIQNGQPHQQGQGHNHDPNLPYLPLPVLQGIEPVSGVSQNGSGVVHAGHIEHAYHDGRNGQIVQAGHRSRCSCAAPNPVPVRTKPSCGHNHSHHKDSHKSGCTCGKNCKCGQQGHGHCGANRTPQYRTPQHNCGGQASNCGNCGGFISSSCCSPCEVVSPCDTCAGSIVSGGIISSGCSTCGTSMPSTYVSGLNGTEIGNGFVANGGTFEGTVIPGHVANGDCPTCQTANSVTTPGPLFHGETIPGQIEPQPEPAKVPASDYEEPLPAKPAQQNSSAIRRFVPVPTKDVSVEGEFVQPNRLNPTTMMLPSGSQNANETRHVHWTPSSVPVFELQ